MKFDTASSTVRSCAYDQRPKPPAPSYSDHNGIGHLACIGINMYTETDFETLKCMASRRDSNGVIEVQSEEVPFVLVSPGAKWLVPYNGNAMLRRLSDFGRKVLGET